MAVMMAGTASVGTAFASRLDLKSHERINAQLIFGIGFE
jgi:hypothetical protein